MKQMKMIGKMCGVLSLAMACSMATCAAEASDDGQYYVPYETGNAINWSTLDAQETPIAEESAAAFMDNLRATYQEWEDPLGELGDVTGPKDFPNPDIHDYQITYGGAATLTVTEERKAQGAIIRDFEININQPSDKVYSDELVLMVLKSVGATKDELVAVAKASENDKSPNDMDTWPVTLRGHKYWLEYGKGHYHMMISID